MNEHIDRLQGAERSSRMSAAEAMREAADALYPEGRGGVHDPSAETATANRLVVRHAALQSVRNALARNLEERAQVAKDAARGVHVVPVDDERSAS